MTVIAVSPNIFSRTRIHAFKNREYIGYIACSAGVFWAHECTFSYQAAILDLVTVEDQGGEAFAEGELARGKKKWARLCTKLLLVKHAITIQDGGIGNLVYLALCSKITPALQASDYFDRQFD